MNLLKNEKPHNNSRYWHLKKPKSKSKLLLLICFCAYFKCTEDILNAKLNVLEIYKSSNS